MCVIFLFEIDVCGLHAGRGVNREGTPNKITQPPPSYPQSKAAACALSPTVTALSDCPRTGSVT